MESKNLVNINLGSDFLSEGKNPFNTLTNVDLSSMGSFGIHPREIPQQNWNISITEKYDNCKLKIMDTSHRINELTHCGLVTLYGQKDLGQHWFR